MGYESKVYVVSESSISLEDNGKVWAEVIAMFDLCKVDTKFVDVFEHEANGYIYIGDEAVTTDKYDDTIKSANLYDVYFAIDDEETYWRLVAFKKYLGELIKNKNNLTRDFESLKVYHYGY